MADDERPKLTTHQKALKINLDPMFYGTFAEIGAGQEVARWFFKVGAAAGTISKSISAYDMAVSDAIYGRCKRYVSRERLQGMLDYEHGLNLERLQSSRGDTTAFFAFANTVAARNYQGTNECHGWMGVKFQAHPRDEDSQIIIHVRMLDRENDLQQEALGIVGVNLLYAAFFLHHKPELMLESLLDNLTTQRIEIDMIEFSGIEFRHVDNRVMSLKLVQLGLSGAAMFGPSGEVLQPSEVLRKRPILVERGSFRPVTKVNIDMIKSAHERFACEPEVEASQVVELMEITMRNLLVGRQDRPHRFSGARGRAGRRRQDRADLGLFRILPPGRLPDALYLAAHRGDHGRCQPSRICSRSSITPASKAASSKLSANSSPRICGFTFIPCGPGHGRNSHRGKR